ncbi:MAG: matrixin [Myxococcaceae bacterium]|nr:matrixin [Myxococcaceae bacterium]MCI0672238.1 matrixin [Myxococcaceae bacterium]
MSGLLAGLLTLAAGQFVFPGPGYNRTLVDNRDRDSVCLYWGMESITYHQAGGTGVTAEQLQAVRRSWQTWNDEFARCGNLALQEGSPTTDRRVGYDPDATDNLNVVLFRTRDCDDAGVVPGNSDPNDRGSIYDCWDYGDTVIALTTNTYRPSSGFVLDSDIEMNAAGFEFRVCPATGCSCPIGSGNCNIADVENTMTHEVGHVVGLDHVFDNQDSTMAASAEPGETLKRSLDLPSRQFVCDVYPQGRPSQACRVTPVKQELGTIAPGCSAGTGAPGLVALAALVRLLGRRRRS